MKTKWILLFVLFAGFLQAQEMPVNASLGQKNQQLNISSRLLVAQRQFEAPLAKSRNSVALVRPTSDLLIQDEKIYVEFVRGAVTDLDKTIDTNLLKRSLKIRIQSAYKNRASAWVAPTKLSELAKKLPVEYTMQEVVNQVEDNQGPALTNSSSYQGNNIGGEGIRIAIFDGGFAGLSTVRNLGQAPAVNNTEFFNLAGGTFEGGDNDHGTACVQTVFDHAPNARYFLFKINSAADLGRAVEICIQNDVNIISHSISRYNLGWGDDTGVACAAANEAARNGILFFTSAGNRNGKHWQGNFNSPDNDNWHNWSGNDEQNTFTIRDNGVVRFYLQWNSASTVDHYDLYLYEAGSNTLLASSTNTNGFESLSYTTAEEQRVYVAIRARSAQPPAFELFNHDDDCTSFQYASTRGSTTSPSNATEDNVISVGAVPRTDYDSNSGTNSIIASYSSRGPTNEGHQAPDLCGPTNTGVVGGSFGGTSCATPNAAGAAAAFWSGHPRLSADGVRLIIFQKAELYKDWGADQADDVYGYGGLYLHDYHQNNRYLLRAGANYDSGTDLPYRGIYNVETDNIVPANLRMIYLEELDYVLHEGQVLNKPELYTSIPGTLIRPTGPPVTLVETETVDLAYAASFSAPEPELNEGINEPLKTKVELGAERLRIAPNPVTTNTNIVYQLDGPGPIQLSMLDVNGKPVRELFNGHQEGAGEYQLSFDAHSIPAGIYFIRLAMGSTVVNQKMIVAR